MIRRCPESKFVGLGILRGWKWFINSRGYANVIQSPDDLVYGMVYEMSPSDEVSMDRWEVVPQDYTKEMMEIELQSVVGGESSLVQGLVYVDERLREGVAWEEYIHRLNMGIRDATAKGLPGWYVDKYMRRFIPAEGGKEVVEGFKPGGDTFYHAATDANPKEY